jgi:hypothetical protein
MRPVLRHLMRALALLATIAACERSRAPVRPDSARTAVPESLSTANTRVPPPSWDPAAGPVLLVRVSSPTSAYVVFPQYSDSTLPDTLRLDPTPLRGTAVQLYGHAGPSGTARIAAVSSKRWDSDSCIEWPDAHLQLMGDTALVANWTVAFESGSVESIRLDSIEGLAQTDSARLAAEVTRLASTLPGDTARTFRGIPFAVRAAYRFSVTPQLSGIVAEVVRKLNQEATPLEQRILLVAEGDATAPTGGGRYHTVYYERSAGTEEALETTEALAAIRFPGSNRIGLILLREGLDTTAYSLLERAPSGQWRLRWTSVHTGC